VSIVRLAALATATLLASSAVARAVDDGTARIGFTSKAAKSSSGLSFDAHFGTGADGRPRILIATKLHLPVGTKLDTDAVATCPLEVGAAIAGGGAAKACPAESLLGTGSADVYIADHAVPAVLGLDLRNLNHSVLVELDHRGVPAFAIDGTISAHGIEFDLAPIQSLGYKVSRIEFSIAARRNGSKPYLRTPPSCPNGKWRGSMEDTYLGGITESVPFTIACAKNH
jgi:hypothetical protein